MLRLTIEGVALTLGVGIPRELWDDFWLGTVQSGAAVRSAFLLIYGLEIVTIVGDDGEVEVVRPAGGFLVTYAGWALYLVTPSAACLDGCQQSRVPT